jgi:dTDP-4-amino-4,6-dideoxygalactose transaminase
VKCSIADLALFGGRPAFEAPLHVGRPNFGDPAAFGRRLERILSSRRFTNDGPFVREFESVVAWLAGTQHAIATCNATIALQLLAQALELRGEVAMPAFTFVATAHAFAWLGLEPVFCDIDATTHGMSPASLDDAIGSRCSAIVAVHTWGIPCDIDGLVKIARRRGLPLLFDAAHAFACTHSGGLVGGSGVAEVFSFHATKFVNAFEGGAITTNDRVLAERLRRLRDFGFAGYDRVVSLGTNAKMSELHAAAGITTLEVLPAIIAANRHCYERYEERLAAVPALRMVRTDTKGLSNYQYVVIEIDPASGIERDAVVRALHAENVYARRYFHPGCHWSAPYASGAHRPNLPVTDATCARVIVLPSGPSVDDEAVDAVLSILEVIVERPTEFHTRAAKSLA